MIQSRNLAPDAGRWYVKRLTAQDAVQNVLQNPTGKPCIIEGAFVHVITGVGSLTIDMGTNATSETTSDNLLDGASLASNGSQVNNSENGGTNGKDFQILAANAYVTADLSAAGTGLVADAYIYLKELNSA